MYPEPLTVIPSNLIGLEFQWRARGHDTFRVTIEVGGRDLGEVLVAEGLARVWPDGDEFWCRPPARNKPWWQRALGL